MAQRVNYSTNPRSYSQLLAAGISPRQIREAINSGLDPSQLPPEYFGITGGYTPQSVGPGASPVPTVGGIDIPPANMADPYGYTPTGGPGSTGAFGTTPNMGFPSNFDVGGYLPSSTTDYLGIPGSTPGNMTQNVGGPMDLAGYGGMTGGGWDLYGGMDWGYAPSYGDYQSYPASDYGSMNWSGNDISNFGSNPGDFAGYLPPSTDAYLGWTDTGGGGVPMSQDFTQTPGDVFAGIQDPVEPFSEPGALPDTRDTPTPSDWVDGLPPITQPEDIPEVPADQPVTPNGTALPQPTSFVPGAVVTSGTPFGSSPGMFQNGTWLAPGSAIGTNFGNMGYSLAGVPGTTIPGMGAYDPITGGYGYSTAIGMYGLGAMNAPGGSFALGVGGPESGIQIRSPGEAPDMGFKHGIDMSTVDSGTGPNIWEQHADNDPYHFWNSRIRQSRRMMPQGPGQSGSIKIDPLDASALSSNAGSYKGWTFNPATGNFEPPATPPAKTAKGAK